MEQAAIDVLGEAMQDLQGAMTSAKHSTGHGVEKNVKMAIKQATDAIAHAAEFIDIAVGSL